MGNAATGGDVSDRGKREGRLATARFADEPQHFAGPYYERSPAHCRDLVRLAAVGHSQSPDLKHDLPAAFQSTCRLTDLPGDRFPYHAVPSSRSLLSSTRLTPSANRLAAMTKVEIAIAGPMTTHGDAWIMLRPS